MRSEVNESLVKKLIREGDEKMKHSEDAFLSRPETLIQEALWSYEKALAQDPKNPIILERIEIAKVRKKEFETEPSPNRRP
jgi:hypothetical protein